MQRKENSMVGIKDLEIIIKKIVWGSEEWVYRRRD